jgi:hypothetical protein
MALDKKHYDIDSAEELDAYGVWVKSEPQDFTASMAETASFDAEAMPYEANFDSGFDDLGADDFGFGDSEDTDTEIPPSDIEDGGFGDLSGGTAAYSEQVSEEASNRFLMKIAGELSSIKTELNSLKREFAEIRAESSGAGDGEKHGGFFAEDDDEKIALTGDEMDHFLSSTDFSEEDGLGFDSLREKDEAALRELSDQNEEAEDDASSEEADEEIKIDFDNLGIDLHEDAEAETETDVGEDFPPLDEETPLEEPSLSAAENDFDDLTFDSGTDELEEGGDFIEELAPIEDSEELKDLRIEGATPLSPAPDNTVYLETDPFALDTSDFEGTPLDENAVKEDPILGAAVAEESAVEESIEESAVEENAIEEDAVSEETALSDSFSSEDMSIGEGGSELSFDDSSFDMGFDDDFSLDSSTATQEEAVAEETVETSATETEPALGDDDMSLDAGSADVSGTFDDDMSLDTGSADVLGTLDDSDLSFDAGPLELSATGLDDTDFSFDDGDSFGLSTDDDGESLELSADDTGESLELSTDDDAESLELSAEEAPPETAEQEFDADPIDLTDAVIDEPDLSAGIVEPPLEEPVLGDISFNDDITLDMDDFGSHVEIEAIDDDEVPAIGVRAIDGGDDSLAQIIPEGFEVNAEEAAVSMDDDLEAFSDDELAITAGTSLADGQSGTVEAGGADIGISPGMKGELKSVLAYMDHLLESLPEEKIEEFAKSEYFDTYKKIFKELGLV